MRTKTIDYSASLKEANQRFLDEVHDWMDTCLSRYTLESITNGHDQGTFMTPWLPVLQHEDHPQAREFLFAFSERVASHFAENGMWHHGYWRKQEAHHGTEHFELSVGTLWQLAADRPESNEANRTKEILLDAAEHIGNWVPEIPEWFDWDTGLFRSMYLGSEVVRLEPGDEGNFPVHFRLVNICLLAHEISYDERYLKLAHRHIGNWADALLAEPEIPVMLHRSVVADQSLQERSYRGFASQIPTLDSEPNRAELFLASNGIETLLTVGRLTGEDRFRKAAERLLDVLAAQLHDPDATAAVAAIRFYREFTGNDRYDQQVMDACADAGKPQALVLEPEPTKHPSRPSGIGKRSDMPNWYEDGKRKQQNPALMLLAAELRGNSSLAAQAVDYARTQFELAREVYPDGHKHGCSARSVSAIARGHGRENNAGAITAVLGPALRLGL